MRVPSHDGITQAPAELEAITRRTGLGLAALCFRKRRTWAIAVRRTSYKSLFLLNSGCFIPRKNKEVQL